MEERDILNYFNDEEKEILNRYNNYVDLSMNKEEFINALVFARMFNPDIFQCVYTWLIKKIEKLSDDDFAMVKNYIPFRIEVPSVEDDLLVEDDVLDLLRYDLCQKD